MSTAYLAAVAAGMAFGLSLIVAVGPQNTFVLRQGIRRRHVLLVVAVCAASDVVLIAAGVSGVGAVVAGRTALLGAIGVIGVAFLLGYAGVAARRALRPTAGGGAAPDTTGTARAVLAAALAFTWLNPGVYIDTVFLVGPVSHSHGGGRWWFAGGAMLASVLWFVVIGFGARAASRFLGRPGAWRVLDALVAIVLVITAVRVITTIRFS